MRIEVYYRQNYIFAIGSLLGVGNELLVIHRMKPQAFVAVQGGVVLADFVYPRDQIAKVPRRKQVPIPDFVFLRVKIFFASWLLPTVAKYGHLMRLLDDSKPYRVVVPVCMSQKPSHISTFQYLDK